VFPQFPPRLPGQGKARLGHPFGPNQNFYRIGKGWLQSNHWLTDFPPGAGPSAWGKKGLRAYSKAFFLLGGPPTPYGAPQVKRPPPLTIWPGANLFWPPRVSKGKRGAWLQSGSSAFAPR